MLIDGLQIVNSLKGELRERAQKLGKKITLAVFLVGNDEGSINFIAQKEKFGAEIGVKVNVFQFEAGVSVSELKQKIADTGKGAETHGIIVQLPLPKNFSKAQTQDILEAIAPEKDPDFLSSVLLGQFYTGTNMLLPPTVGAFVKAVEIHNMTLKKGSIATIVGQGDLIGKPLVTHLMKEEMTVFSCNKFTKNLSKFTKMSDLVISGVGVPKLIKAGMIKKGATVIDFGFAMRNGKIAGDVDTEKVAKVAKYVSPVPGGVGPITVAMLFSNLIDMQS